jgi:L-fuculose-phosphate aldolase
MSPVPEAPRAVPRDRPDPTEAALRRELVVGCRRLDSRNLVGAGEGNVSCRLSAGRFLVTPAGARKGELAPGDLLVVSRDGTRVKGKGRPSSELAMHLAVYRARPDVTAVVHAHPLTALAFTVAGLPPPSCSVESVTLGKIGIAPCAVPGTREVPRSVTPLLGGHEVILLERHGALTLGRTVREAFDRMELLERAAQVAAMAASLAAGEVRASGLRSSRPVESTSPRRRSRSDNGRRRASSARRPR